MEPRIQGSGSSDRLDYAIVGAGVSGLYTAWRLLEDAKKHQQPLKIGIFEMGDRTGGRLLTWLPTEGLRAELGGMRFFEAQRLVWTLVEHLGFDAKKLTSFWVDGPNLRLLLRGVSTLAGGSDPTARYDLPSNLRGLSAGKIIGNTITNVLQAPENWPVIERELGGLEPDSGLPKDREAWDKIKKDLKWRGTPLWNVGFWNLLSDIHTAETYQYLVDALGYFSLAGNWNAAEAMQFIALDFSVTEYMSLDRGYSALPDTLAQQAGSLGCKIELNTRLVSFEGQPDGSSRLRLASTKDGKERTVEAEHVVLAMPRRSLELLAPSNDFNIQGNGKLKRLITTVKPQPAFKLYLFYDERWWERYGITHGRSISDLPLRQTYYFAPQPWGDGTIPRYGMLLASYNDARAVDYWQGFVPREPVADTLDYHATELMKGVGEMIAAGLPPGAKPPKTPKPPPHLHLATPEMLSHVRSQLALLHDIPESEVPEARVGGYGDWGRDPWGGGWNFWDSQVNVEEAMTEIKMPLGKKRRVYIVGDAYSGDQGWVEGALTATEKALQVHFKLAPPDWLQPKDYYLGW